MPLRAATFSPKQNLPGVVPVNVRNKGSTTRTRRFVITRLPTALRIKKETGVSKEKLSPILTPITKAIKALQSRLYNVRSISRAKNLRHGAVTFGTVSFSSSGGALPCGISIMSR